MTDFITKDSGERQTFSTGMVRDSGAKALRPDLLPLFMVRRMRDAEFIVEPEGTILDYLGPWPWYVLAEMSIVLVAWALLTLPWVRKRADSGAGV